MILFAMPSSLNVGAAPRGRPDVETVLTVGVGPYVLLQSDGGYVCCIVRRKYSDGWL